MLLNYYISLHNLTSYLSVLLTSCQLDYNCKAEKDGENLKVSPQAEKIFFRTHLQALCFSTSSLGQIIFQPKV